MKQWRTMESAPDGELETVQLWNGVRVMAGSRWEGGWVDNLLDWIHPQPFAWKPLSDPPIGAIV